MLDITEEFGFNAGRVWKTLEINGPLTQEQLIEETCLREHEVYAAIGWLARENKIHRNGNIYCLNATNLTYEIGGDAGEIWDVLSRNGELDTNNISKLIEKDEKNIFSALGWLARENKIQLQKKNVEY